MPGRRIDRYGARLSGQEAPRSVRKAVRLKERIATRKEEMRRLEGLEKANEGQRRWPGLP